MNYSELFTYCRDGWTKAISSMLKNNDKVDILWRDGQLLQAASQSGSAEVLNILINYYIAHIAEEPGSDKYLSSMFKLIEKLDNARQLSEKFSPEVIETFNKYIPADYDEESDDGSDFGDSDTTIAAEGGVSEGADGYSSDEFHRRVSDSSDCINLADISALAVSTTGETHAPPE